MNYKYSRKKFLIFLVIIFVCVGISFVYAQTEDICFRAPANGNDTFSVGEVRTSILNEIDFQSMNGPEWVLMDGRILFDNTNVEIIPYLAQRTGIGQPQLPDARGRFLRMADHGAGIDPNGDRELGSSQSDALQNIVGTVSGISEAYTRGGSASGAFNKITGTKINGTPRQINESQSDSVNFDASRVARTSSETRPSNIVVNYFVKICSCRSEQCK